MKHIFFKRIRLENFKAFPNLEISFAPDVTNIFGRNESGKTTVLDAITWCLFNKDHLYRTAFAIKTHGADGIDIPRLNHSVELEISINGIDRTLRRTLKERWVKPHGETETVFSGNYQECYIDGQSVSSTDYTKCISDIVNETVFKSITSPTYFLSLPWATKRKFLSLLAGEIKQSDITGDDQLFDPLLAELQKQSIEDYHKHLRFQIRELRKKLDMVPVRLKEQEKALPEKQDWDDIERQIKEKTTELDTLRASIIEEKTMSPSDVKRKHIKEDIEKQRIILADREKVVEDKYNSILADTQKEYKKANAKIASNNNEKVDLQVVLKQCENIVANNREAVADLTKQKVDFRGKWESEQRSSFSAPDDVNVCPTCGQYLPEEQLKEKISLLKAQFNESKADKIAELRAVAEKIKMNEEELKRQFESATIHSEEARARIGEIDKENEYLANVPALPDVSIRDLLIEDGKYCSADEKVHELEKALENVEDSPIQEVDEETRSKEKELDLLIKSLTTTLASKVQFDKVSTYISELNEENRILAQQIADLEKQEDILVEYKTRADSILEDRVNKHFSLVRWKMFRTLVNGNREAYCEATFKGTEAADGLNSAGYIMAGVDICNAIAKYYDISAPVVIDNAESINNDNFLDTEGQQIRLFVSEDEKLTVR